MPSNASVIPGVYGFGDDLASALQAIGKGLAAPGIAEQLKIEKAMETFRDPVLMEKAATDLATAQMRDELNPNFGDVASDANASSEMSRVQDSYMAVAGLDPTNPKHRQAAMGILGTAFQSLPAPQRAAARLSAVEAHRKKEEKIQQKQQDTRETIVETQDTQATMVQQATELARGMAVHLDEVRVKALQLDLMKTAMRLQAANTDQIEQIMSEIPELAALYSVAPEAFAQGLIALLGRSASGGETIGVPEMKILQEAQAERDSNFLLKLQEASQLSGDEALAKLTEALQGRESYKQYGRLLPQSRFPASFETYLAGWMRLSTKVQLMFSLPPSDPKGIPINSEGWADWVNMLADLYEDAEDPAGRKEVQEFMVGSDLWQSMTFRQREQAIAQLAGLDVLFPEMIVEFRELRAAREKEERLARQGGRPDPAVERVQEITGVTPRSDN